MKLGWKTISIISRFTAVGIGLIQSVVIVKILPVNEYGLIGLVGSIAAVVGVYQNLGISSGSTREISAAKSPTEAFKVFIGSVFVRYAISLPLIVGLFAASPYLGNVVYKRPEIILPLRIFSLVLLIQGFQSVLNSVIQGLKKFKFLFIFQALIAFVSLTIFIPFILKIGFLGYFYAMLTFNTISTVILAIYVKKLFKEVIKLPSTDELKKIIKSIFSIGLFVYVIKIILIQWEKLGPLLLGKTVNDESLGILAFALLVSSKISTISDAITDVTLPSMTEVYENSKEKFIETFLKSNSQSYIFIMFAAVLVVILKREVFQIIDFIFVFIGKSSITEKYEGSFAIMDPFIVAFWAYSHLNLIKSGLAVPTKTLKESLMAFFLMFVLTIAFYFVMPFEPLMSFALAMGLGGLLAYIFLLFMTRYRLKFYPITQVDIMYSLVSLVILLLHFFKVEYYILVPIYLLFTLFFYVKKIKNTVH